MTGTFQSDTGGTSIPLLSEKQTGTKKYTCGASGCSNSDLVGAHVQKANSSDKSWYITPLCKACNQRTDEFDVFWDLVPVPSNL